MNTQFDFSALPHAYAELGSSGKFRVDAQDFIVNEQIGFSVTGEGEHVLLKIRKTGKNTEEVARILARYAKVPRKSVGYAGLKDKNAVTTQHFSVHLPKQAEPDWDSLADASFEILSAHRHKRKIRRGALSHNDFVIRIRSYQGNHVAIEQRLELIKQHGVPNYFAAQRFGHDMSNLEWAGKMFTGGVRVRDRFRKNMYLSAARSWLFNLVLAERIRNDTWNRAINGDCMSLSRSRACFSIDVVDEEIANRVNDLDISPSGPLPGRGRSMVTADAALLENKLLTDWAGWVGGLENAGQELARRALCLPVDDLLWEWLKEDVLQLTFSLPPGSYATAVLRELGDITEPVTGAREQSPKS